jgi:hypothetical protein
MGADRNALGKRINRDTGKTGKKIKESADACTAAPAAIAGQDL